MMVNTTAQSPVLGVLSRHKQARKDNENKNEDLKILTIKLYHGKVIEEGIVNNNNYHWSVYYVL